MSNLRYKRVVIKISGEALAGEKKTGFDFDFISDVCEVLKANADKVRDEAEKKGFPGFVTTKSGNN